MWPNAQELELEARDEGYDVMRAQLGFWWSLLEAISIYFAPIHGILDQAIEDLFVSTPLLTASKEGHYVIICLLVENRACAAEQDRYQQRALFGLQEEGAGPSQSCSTKFNQQYCWSRRWINKTGKLPMVRRLSG